MQHLGSRAPEKEERGGKGVASVQTPNIGPTSAREARHVEQFSELACGRMSAGTRSGTTGIRKTMSVNDLKPKARQSSRQSGGSEQRPGAEPSQGPPRHSKRRQSKGTCQKPEHKHQARADRASVMTAGSKRKAPALQKQQPADSGQAVRSERQSKRLRRKAAAAAPAAARPVKPVAKPAAPRQVAVLGRSRTTGRRHADSVTWDGETYLVCGRLLPYSVSIPLPALLHAEISYVMIMSPRKLTCRVLWEIVARCAGR